MRVWPQGLGAGVLSLGSAGVDRAQWPQRQGGYRKRAQWCVGMRGGCSNLQSPFVARSKQAEQSGWEG